jgi:hypothetical protein
MLSGSAVGLFEFGSGRPGVPHVDPFPFTFLTLTHRFTGSNLSLYFYSHQSKISTKPSQFF